MEETSSDFWTIFRNTLLPIFLLITYSEIAVGKHLSVVNMDN